MIIDDYLAKVSEPQKTDLENIRQFVKKRVPDAQEVVSYGMPAFKYKGKYLIGYFAYKDHMSIFPTPGPIEVLKAKLTDFKLSKGTIQFTHDKQMPESLLSEIIATRITEIDNE